jgi:hypothetical protein
MSIFIFLARLKAGQEDEAGFTGGHCGSWLRKVCEHRIPRPCFTGPAIPAPVPSSCFCQAVRTIFAATPAGGIARLDRWRFNSNNPTDERKTEAKQILGSAWMRHRSRPRPKIMILHRYFGSHALETLREAKLKTSRISSFNDSFEFLYVTVGQTTPEEAKRYVNAKSSDPVVLFDLIEANRKSANPRSASEIKNRLSKMAPVLEKGVIEKWPQIAKETELSVERRRQIIDRELRAICFSDPDRVKRAQEILLWSHYARRHEGIRIGFEFPAGVRNPFEIIEITYQEKRVEVVFSLEGEQQTLNSLEKAATVKSKVWEYEGEFRLFTKLDRCEPRETKKCTSTTIEHFLGFHRDWVKSVDFGVFCPVEEMQPVLDLVRTDYPNVVPRKAEFDKTEYALQYKEIH